MLSLRPSPFGETRSGTPGMLPRVRTGGVASSVSAARAVTGGLPQPSLAVTATVYAPSGTSWPVAPRPVHEVLSVGPDAVRVATLAPEEPRIEIDQTTGLLAVSEIVTPAPRVGLNAAGVTARPLMTGVVPSRGARPNGATKPARVPSTVATR